MKPIDMKLPGLNEFEVLNNETLNVITGGAGQDTKKKDVKSEKQDSASNDHFGLELAR
ncbi:ComC/BlpC family leader-containing pheromone/bacteriocin [Tenacibaculum litopenaei]|jgi:bacteriocin-like protein|uniref:ComC/BlpC family leader-containing pheromone/bacteriocin n=1 Tax=Tenacibaculum litopenaei TaxID=396016 RepID=UPI0038B4FE9A